MALRIAPRGWEHPAWNGPFYPDDLPPEWRLIYFCTQFDAVVVPADRWRAATAELAAWAEECATGSRFYLELEAAPDADALAAARSLGSHFGGFVRTDVEEAAIARWSAGDLRVLRARMEGLAPRAQETLLIIEGDPPSLETLRAARALAELLGVAG